MPEHRHITGGLQACQSPVLQRGHTDFSTLRNIGSALGYAVVAFHSILQGLQQGIHVFCVTYRHRLRTNNIFWYFSRQKVENLIQVTRQMFSFSWSPISDWATGCLPCSQSYQSGYARC